MTMTEVRHPLIRRKVGLLRAAWARSTPSRTPRSALGDAGDRIFGTR